MSTLLTAHFSPLAYNKQDSLNMLASLKSNPPNLHRAVDHCSEDPDGSGFCFNYRELKTSEDVCFASEHVVCVCCLLSQTVFMFMLS